METNPHDQNPEEIWLNNKEAAKYLFISVSTLNRRREAGEIIYYKEKRKLIYKRSDLDDYRNGSKMNGGSNK